MEDIFVAKIIETENQAEKIVLQAKEKADSLIEENKLKNSLDTRQLEKKYDEIVSEKQDAIKQEFENDFNKNLDDMKLQTDQLKSQSMQNYEKALKILLSEESDNGNS